MKAHTTRLSAVLSPDDARLGYSENELRTLFGAPFALVDVSLLPRPETMLEPLPETSRHVNTQALLNGLRTRVQEETLEPAYDDYEGLAFDYGDDPFLPHAFGLTSSSVGLRVVPSEQVEGVYTEVRADRWSRGGRLVTPFMQAYGVVLPCPSAATSQQMLRVSTGLPEEMSLPDVDEATCLAFRKMKLLELAVSLRQGQILLLADSETEADRAEEALWVYQSAVDATTCVRALAAGQQISLKAQQLYIDAHLISALCGRFNDAAAPEMLEMTESLQETNLAASSLVGSVLPLASATTAYAELHIQMNRVMAGQPPLPAGEAASLMKPMPLAASQMMRYLTARAQHDSFVYALPAGAQLVGERFKALSSLVAGAQPFASPEATYIARATLSGAQRFGLV